MGGTHCHVELVESSFFMKPPKATHTVSQIQQILDRLVEQEIKCELSGEFAVENSELPRFVQTMFLDIKEGNVSFRTAAGRFEVSGAPVHAISWAFDDQGKNAMLKFDATKVMTVSDSYLVEGFQVILSGFTALITGGTPRAEG
jgi:hypothetical protein